MKFINEQRCRFGVEPICQALEVAPSTYYAAISRPPSLRQLRDEELTVEIARVHRESYDGTYGIEKVRLQLNREKIEVGRDRVARLMRELGLEGALKGKKKRTTVPADLADRPADLVHREFKADGPNRLIVG